MTVNEMFKSLQCDRERFICGRTENQLPPFVGWGRGRLVMVKWDRRAALQTLLT